MIRPFLVSCLLIGVMLAPTIAKAGSIEINSNGWDFNDDDNLTLREAQSIATGNIALGKRCFRRNERLRTTSVAWSLGISGLCGRGFYDAPREAFCRTIDNTHNDSLWVVTGGAGAGDADQINFSNDVASPIRPTSPIVIGDSDTLSGRKPDATRVQIDGSLIVPTGLPDGAISLLLAENRVFAGIEVMNSSEHGFAGVAPHAVTIRDCYIHNNAGDGINLTGGGVPGAETSPLDNNIGTSGAGGGNIIANNGGSGVAVVGLMADSGFAHNNKIVANNISGNAGDGVRIIQSRQNAIGQPGLGNVITGSNGNAISMTGGNSDSNTVQGNSIGGNPSGTNGRGIVLQGGADGNQIGGLALADGNEIINSVLEAIDVNDADNNVIEGNYIGRRKSGTTNGNGRDGLIIHDGSINNRINHNFIVANGKSLDSMFGWGVHIADATSTGSDLYGNWIGINASSAVSGNNLGGIRVNGANGTAIGKSGAAGNVISGNGNGPGVLIEGGAQSVSVRLNRIGVNAGNAAAANQSGIVIRGGAHANVIGGSTSLGNTISGNAGPGISIDGETSDANVISGNLIGIAGASLSRPNAASGVLIQNGADNTVVGGATSSESNWISANARDGVEVQGDSTDATVIRINYIGLDLSGSSDFGNARNGVLIFNGDGSSVQANYISGNGNDGINLDAGANVNAVFGNIVGLGVSLGAGIGNAASGIVVYNSADNSIGVSSGNLIMASGSAGIFVGGAAATGNRFENNTIGALNLAHDTGNGGSGIILLDSANLNIIRNNLIAGNGVAGIDLLNADNNTIAGNRIGGASTTFVRGNPRGIRIHGGSSGNTVGGPNAGVDRNIVVAATLYGIGIFNAGSNANALQNNRIGLFDDSSPMGNSGNGGVLIQEGASSNVLIGNIIDANVPTGVFIRNLGTLTEQNQLYGNTISNNGLQGVLIADGASHNVLGGNAANQRNFIVGNGDDGVAITGGTGNWLASNNIWLNDGDEIDLGVDGATGNDGNDTDSGPNGLQNFPVISTVVTEGGSTSITFSLDSAANTNYPLYVYGYNLCEANGRATGFNVANASVPTNASGDYAGTLMLPATVWTRLGLTATNFNSGDSSEISPCVENVGALFANSFEPGSALHRTASDNVLITVDWLAPEEGHIDAEWQIQNASTTGIDDFEIVFGVLDPVAVSEVSGDASCHFDGRLHCRIGHLAANTGARIVMSLSASADRALRFTIETPADTTPAARIFAMSARAGANSGVEH